MMTRVTGAPEHPVACSIIAGWKLLFSFIVCFIFLWGFPARSWNLFSFGRLPSRRSDPTARHSWLFGGGMFVPPLTAGQLSRQMMMAKFEWCHTMHYDATPSGNWYPERTVWDCLLLHALYCLHLYPGLSVTARILFTFPTPYESIYCDQPLLSINSVVHGV